MIRKGKTRKEFMTGLSKEEGIRGYVAQSIYGDQVNQVYNESLILLDRTIYSNIGTRVFETIGSGGFALVNRGTIPSGLDKLAMDGAHFVSYDDTYADCLEKMHYYIENHAAREKIAKCGEAHFRNNHTYGHRFNTILDDLGYAQ